MRLLQLLADNRRQFTPVESRIVASGEEAAIYLYDPIVGSRIAAEWFGGVCPQDMVPAIRAITAKEITLYTNCPGGDVFAAEAICQALREHPAKITMQIEGFAASAATAIACACDEVTATKASKYMIHQSWTMAIGNAENMDEVAALLRKCDQSLYEAYQAKTGKTLEEIQALCAAETWFTAEEAVAAGFIDRVLDPAQAKASANGWNLSAYGNPPTQAGQDTPPPAASPEEPCASADHRARQEQRIRALLRLSPPQVDQ